MGDEDGGPDCENGRSSTEGQQREEEVHGRRNDEVLKFLDSVDGYLTLFESLSSTLRQGWLDLASARHSMGALRINSALFDLKDHSAATSLQVSEVDVDSTIKQPNFTLCKWGSPENQKHSFEEAEFDEDDLIQRKSTQLRYRGTSEIQVSRPESIGPTLTVDNQIQKERLKLLSMFGTLVSPKLRAAQLSFETALDILVEIANIQSSMLSSYEQLRNEMERASV
ncbi:hypothetical protein NMG60_11022729 [Bertholletia excelsa]